MKGEGIIYWAGERLSAIVMGFRTGNLARRNKALIGNGCGYGCAQVGSLFPCLNSELMFLAN